MRGSGSSSWVMRRCDLAVCQRRLSAVSISDAAIPAPSRRHNIRNGRSVTPAIGASARGEESEYGPICTKRRPSALLFGLISRAFHVCRNAQAHIDLETHRVLARINDRDVRIDTLPGTEQFIPCRHHVQILARLEIAQAHTPAEPVVEGEAQQRVGLGMLR